MTASRDYPDSRLNPIGVTGSRNSHGIGTGPLCSETILLAVVWRTAWHRDGIREYPIGRDDGCTIGDWSAGTGIDDADGNSWLRLESARVSCESVACRRAHASQSDHSESKCAS